MKQVEEAAKNLRKRNKQLHDALRIGLGETAAPGYWARCAVSDGTRTPLCEEYSNHIFAEYEEFADAVRNKLSKCPPWRKGTPLSAENLWLWGGPTPEWGGSMQVDTLPFNAHYFGIEKGVYVYGATTEAMLHKQADLKQLLCMVSSSCRAPGQQPESDEECAENLSRLSLKFPGITGGMLDDMTSDELTVTPEKVQQIAAISKSLKKHNPALELYGVVYQHELAEKDFSELLPYLDGVTLWFWNQEQLLELERHVTHCRCLFHKKKILLGMFIHDYGTADAGTLPELLIHQLKGARQLLEDGKIHGLVILGDRELLKWPEQAAAIRGFLAGQ